MSETKRDQVREFIRRSADEAVRLESTKMSDRTAAEAVRLYVERISGAICWHICEEYRFLELADIMEWKRTRVRR